MNYTRLNEGQQAEEYKARKAKEEKEREESKNNHRYNDNHTGCAREIGERKEKVNRDGSVDHMIPKEDHAYSKTPGSKNNNVNRTSNHVIKGVVRRYYDGNETHGNDYIDDYIDRRPDKEDKRREKYAMQAAKRAIKPGLFPDDDTKMNIKRTADAVNRNMRRHPERWNKSHHESCGIFESVRFLDE